jgi:hypothetical protein
MKQDTKVPVFMTQYRLVKYKRSVTLTVRNHGRFYYKVAGLDDHYRFQPLANGDLIYEITRL